MQLRDKVVVVTGGGNGIGAAMCLRFAAEGAAGIVVADIDAAAAQRVADEVGGLAVPTDVSDRNQVYRLVEQATTACGPIDLFCSNAGIETGGGIDAPEDAWRRIWGVNVAAHMFAAQAVVPGMIAHGGGYLLQTVSAAGLLTQMSSLPYSVTKHAALGMAEWLAITYGDAGIKVSCVCPLGVRTDMLMGVDDPVATHLRENAVDPAHVADAIVKGLADEQFLILPHPEVGEFFRRKADNYDRWLKGMRRLRASLPGMPQVK